MLELLLILKHARSVQVERFQVTLRDILTLELAKLTFTYDHEVIPQLIRRTIGDTSISALIYYAITK